MSDTYSIHKEVLNRIFYRVVAENAFVNKQNANCVQDILLRECSDSTVETIIHLMLTNEEYKPLKIGDYIKFKPPTYHAGSEYEVDILDDLGLLPKEPGYVYGIIKGDGSWSTSEPFNPFYNRLKVDCLYHCGEKKVKIYEHELNPLQCIRVTKGSIPHFKKQKTDAKIINRTD